MTELELARAAAKALDSKKALDLKILRITELSVIADYFVIATGTSNTQVKALADEVEFRLKEQGVAPGHMEGYHSNPGSCWTTAAWWYTSLPRIPEFL